jgi:DNA-directed RNA polymerase specialized sigma24 family protein
LSKILRRPPDGASKTDTIESREILALREIEGWSYERLASALKVPLGTVMSRLSRARQRLREEFAGVRHTELQDEL